MIDEHAASELELFIENDGDLYRSQTVPTFKNLATKKARGEYKHDLAVKLFSYLVEAGAKKYAKEFGGTWHQMFGVPTRRAVAESFTKSFETEHALGNYDHLLPKKYQEVTGNGSKKKSPAQLDHEIRAILGPGHFARTVPRSSRRRG
jgi:hypothetical protein